MQDEDQDQDEDQVEDKKAKTKYGKAQDDFIKSIRASIDADPNHFFDDKDWRYLTVKGGRYVGLNNPTLEPSSFYVKPVAAWVPHLLIPGHVPSCPKCCHPQCVNPTTSNWVTSPKLLHGLKGHRYLDTKSYYCSGCTSRFNGYDLKSIELDSKKLLGFFTFHLSKKYAVDDELYNEIVNSGDEPSASLERRLEQNTKDQYFSDFQYYLFAVKNNRVRVVPKHTVPHDAQQETLDKHLQPMLKQTSADKNLTVLRRQADLKKWDLERANAAMEDALDFKQIMVLKGGRNSRNQILPGLGIGKLKKLIKEGIPNGKALLTYDDIDQKFRDKKGRNPVDTWKETVEKEYTARATTLRMAKKEFDRISRQFKRAQVAVRKKEVENETELPRTTISSGVDEPRLLPPMFSSMCDPRGYNACFISKHCIDSLLTTEHDYRKPVQLGKMYGLKAEILKMDFNYKMAKKIRVYYARGKGFLPYKCFWTIQNEDALTLAWKGLSGSESLRGIENDLIMLKKRLDFNSCGDANGGIKAIYADNCCQVSKKLLNIFPNIEVKLDAFHWLKRWSEEIQDNNSRQAALFRSLMSRALFVVSSQEYNRASIQVEKKLKRKPTVLEILRASFGSIPAPNILEPRVLGVMGYCLHEDLKVDWAHSQIRDDEMPDIGQSTIPTHFFKKSVRLNHLIRSQLKHVRLGCLTDPANFSILRINPKSGTVRTCRGTNTNEADNLHIDRLTGNQIGVKRADRLIGSFFERNNHRKRIERLGEEDYGTFRTEQLALLNSLAVEIGYREEDLPFPNTTHPAEENRFGENLGFNINTPSDIVDAGDAGDATTNQENDDASVEVGSDDEEDEEEARADRSFAAEIAVEVSTIVPTILRKNESTMEAFTRLTGNTQWIPFHKGPPRNELEKAENALFEELQKPYKANFSPSHPEGYNHFETEWNLKVVERLESLAQGNENVVLVRRKSAAQLKEYFLHLQEAARIASFVDPSSPHMQHLRTVMRESRMRMPTPREPEISRTVEYTQPGSRPLGTATLSANPSIVLAAMETRPDMSSTSNLGSSFKQLCIGVAPWIFSKDIQVPIHPLAKFRFQKFCAKCGFLKKDHAPCEGFGKEQCKRNYCGKCNQREDLHTVGGMGPFCRSDMIWEFSQHPFWYDHTSKPRKPRQKIVAQVPSPPKLSNDRMSSDPTSQATQMSSQSVPRNLENPKTPRAQAQKVPAILPKAIVKLKDPPVQTLKVTPSNPPVPSQQIPAQLWFLTKEKQDVVNVAMKKTNAEEIICTIGTDTVTVQSLKSLRPRTWVNDEVINGYLKFLDLQHKKLCRERRTTPSHLFGSFFITQLTEELVDEAVVRSFNYDRVKTWSKKAPGRDLFELDKVLFPINQTNYHWMLAVAFMQEKCIRFYDSNPHEKGDSQFQHYVGSILNYLKREHKDKHKVDMEEWTKAPEDYDTPQQDNGYDCGVFVCALAEHILFDMPLKFSQKDIPRARQHIAFTLIQQGQDESVKDGKAY